MTVRNRFHLLSNKTENRNVVDYKHAKDCPGVGLREEMNFQELDLLY